MEGCLSPSRPRSICSFTLEKDLPRLMCRLTILPTSCTYAYTPCGHPVSYKCDSDRPLTFLPAPCVHTSAPCPHLASHKCDPDRRSLIASTPETGDRIPYIHVPATCVHRARHKGVCQPGLFVAPMPALSPCVPVPYVHPASQMCDPENRLPSLPARDTSVTAQEAFVDFAHRHKMAPGSHICSHDVDPYRLLLTDPAKSHSVPAQDLFTPTSYHDACLPCSLVSAPRSPFSTA